MCLKRLFEQHELQACQFLAKSYHELNKNIVSELLHLLDRVGNRYCQYIMLLSFDLAWQADSLGPICLLDYWRWMGESKSKNETSPERRTFGRIETGTFVIEIIVQDLDYLLLAMVIIFRSY